MTYPAPAYLEDDEWFGPAPIRTEKQKDYMKMETQMKIQEAEERQNWTNEVEDIHEAMYIISTKVATTLKMDPLPPLGGGSETFQESWQSGSGLLY
jgi:hypothetical protein|tara:strand:+ start:1724 stop:2011 length:288 start_codon:yes stop_codon:yes gene_type:complete